MPEIEKNIPSTLIYKFFQHHWDAGVKNSRQANHGKWLAIASGQHQITIFNVLVSSVVLL